MTRRPLTVHTPDGGVLTVNPTVAPGAIRLSDLLERGGIPLNTQCGGRGQCRGCQVILDPGNKRLRACQTTWESLPDGEVALTVPARSWRDHALHGVSAFQIRRPIAPRARRSGYGLALDIGTTTLAAALWDREQGLCLAAASQSNPQRRYGDNLVARIAYAADAEAAAALHDCLVREGLTPLVEAVAVQAGIAVGDIAEAVAAGNPPMLHTLAGRELTGFARFPFAPAFVGRQEIAGTSCGLRASVRVHLLSAAAPFVGADITAGAWASNLEEHDGPVLFIDFGTNGEILLKTSDDWLATATAAGPAFEGGRLTHGAAAGAGVVSHLRFADGAWVADWPGGPKEVARGLSGAAYVDFLALARRHEILNTRGRLNPEHPLVSVVSDDGETHRVCTVAPGLTISETDVAELLQAKAAIEGGVATLREEAGLSADALTAVYVAGGFGYHLVAAHARAIGLLPGEAATPVHQVGNASLAGASWALLNGQEGIIDDFAAAIRGLELNATESFEDHYIDALRLP